MGSLYERTFHDKVYSVMNLSAVFRVKWRTQSTDASVAKHGYPYFQLAGSSAFRFCASALLWRPISSNLNHVAQTLAVSLWRFCAIAVEEIKNHD